MADVKSRMSERKVPSGVACEGAFVTQTGSTKVEGWITNDTIEVTARADHSAPS